MTAQPYVSTETRRRLLVSRQLLTAAAVDPVRAADTVVALHSSDPASVHLSLLARLPGATVESIERCLHRDRSLVRVHGMRRTLWVASVPVAADIVAGSRSRLVSAERRRLAGFIERDGLNADGARHIDEAAEQIMAFVAENGPCDTRAVGQALPHLTVPVVYGAGRKEPAGLALHTRILLILGFTGRLVRAEPGGGWSSSQYRWSTAEAWLGRPLVPPDPDPDSSREPAARRAVVERYLRRFGPVTETDVAWWTGWTLGSVRRSLNELDTVEVMLEGCEQPGLVMADDLDAVLDGDCADTKPGQPAVTVLPGLDPTTMGWKLRHWYIEPGHTRCLFDRNGNGGPTLWVDGRIVGGWAQRNDGEIVHRLLDDVGREAADLVDAELDRLGRRLVEADGAPRLFKVRFPSPLNTELRR